MRGSGGGQVGRPGGGLLLLVRPGFCGAASPAGSSVGCLRAGAAGTKAGRAFDGAPKERDEEGRPTGMQMGRGSPSALQRSSPERPAGGGGAASKGPTAPSSSAAFLPQTTKCGFIQPSLFSRHHIPRRPERRIPRPGLGGGGLGGEEELMFPSVPPARTTQKAAPAFTGLLCGPLI